MTIETIVCPGVSELEHLGLHRALADALDEGARHLEVDVRLEQREAHLAQPRLDVLLAELALAGEPLEDVAEPVGEGVEHQAPLPRARSTCARRLGLDAVAAVELGGEAEPLLEALQLRERPPHQVVGAAAGAAQVLGELGDRPVLVEVQAAGLALMVGEHGAVDVEQPLARGVVGRGGERA